MPLLSPATPPPPTYYEIEGGLRLPRVTSILGVLRKPALERWRGRLGNDEADRVGRESAAFGTAMHAALERVNRAWGDREALALIAMETEGAAGKALIAYADWLAARARRVVAVEHLAVSRWHGFAGTVDCVLELATGELATVDFKSSKAGPWHPDATWRAQLAAYRLALAENGMVCQRRLVLQLPSDDPGRLIVHDLANHRADTAAFLSLLEVYRWLNA